jgi:cobalamin biosynthesis Co2+ chelatase CbiK
LDILYVWCSISRKHELDTHDQNARLALSLIRVILSAKYNVILKTIYAFKHDFHEVTCFCWTLKLNEKRSNHCIFFRIHKLSYKRKLTRVIVFTGITSSAKNFTLFACVEIWLMLMLMLKCCERKTLFHG